MKTKVVDLTEKILKEEETIDTANIGMSKADLVYSLLIEECPEFKDLGMDQQGEVCACVAKML